MDDQGGQVTTTIYQDDSKKVLGLALAAAGLVVGGCGLSLLALRVPDWSAAILADSQAISAMTQADKATAWKVVTWMLVISVGAVPVTAFSLAGMMVARMLEAWRRPMLPDVRVSPAARPVQAGAARAERQVEAGSERDQSVIVWRK